MGKNKYPPDFHLFPWRENNVFRLLSEDRSAIGRYIEYINERTGDFGVKIEISGVRDPILAWEESLIFKGIEINCRYVAYQTSDGWRKIRVKNYYPSRIACEASGGIRKVTMYFDLVIKGDINISLTFKF